MPPSPPRSGGHHLVHLAVAAVLSLTAVATSTSTETKKNPFTWLDCPSPTPSPSPSSLPPPNSTFRSNLLALLDALPPAAAPAGFASLSRGDADLAFVRGICRGDSAPYDCDGCLRRAALDITRRCSSSRRAAIWYDKCFLSYADTNASTAYEEGFRQELHISRKVFNDKEDKAFDEITNFVIGISDLAANGGGSSSEPASTARVPMYATGEAVYSRGRGAPNGTMYGMVQCMRDRTAAECALCLWNSMVQQAAATGVTLGYNCYLRVEIYPFYDVALDVLPPPAPPPPSTPAPTSFVPTVGETNRNGGSVGVIAGVVCGIVALLLGAVLYIIFHTRRHAKKAHVIPISEDSILLATTSYMDKIASCKETNVPGITIDRSVNFSNEELFNATKGFSMSNKMGQGGFGSVYYAELRGEKAAIKKMDLQATKEFLAELMVLTHVHHQNLVRLIGYCIETSFRCLRVYGEWELTPAFVWNCIGYKPLSWATRVQIALDSARGLEYIHEHTVPVYIHRDIKSENILIDKNYRAKVADFGLAKLAEVGNTSLPTRRIVGTFGYMPPEYAQYGDISPKIDVYAFGVVLYELISAKEAIVRATERYSDSRGLVYLFEEALNTDPKEGLQKLIDPALGEDYPMESILKMTFLARACTQKDPESRLTMRSVVVALMTMTLSLRNEAE